MKAKTFDSKFDAGEEIVGHLDLSKARRIGTDAKRVNVDLPAKSSSHLFTGGSSGKLFVPGQFEPPIDGSTPPRNGEQSVPLMSYFSISYDIISMLFIDTSSHILYWVPCLAIGTVDCRR